MLSPIIEEAPATLVRVLSPPAIARQWQEQLAVEVDPGFGRLTELEHWRCEATGLEWYEPAEAAGSGRLYEQLSKTDWYYTADKWEFGTALGLLESHGSLLEVGPGVGHFLRAARDRGLDPVGVELNPAAIASIRAAGFEAFDEELEPLGERLGARFDAACAFQVLEHVPDPVSFLRQVVALVRPGGSVILSVPNAAVMRYIDPDHTNLLDQPPHHMSHWDEGVFRALERVLPIRLADVRREPLQAYHVDWFVWLMSAKVNRAAGPYLGPVVANRWTRAVARAALHCGLRKLVNGHTLLVRYRKVD